VTVTSRERAFNRPPVARQAAEAFATTLEVEPGFSARTAA
jgi:hypothetical protein